MSDHTALILQAREMRREASSDGMSSVAAHLITRLADALESLQPRTVATAEEIDALPVDTLISVFDTMVYRKTPDGWVWALEGNVSRRPLTSRGMVGGDRPLGRVFTVIYTPEVSA